MVGRTGVLVRAGGLCLPMMVSGNAVGELDPQDAGVLEDRETGGTNRSSPRREE